MRSSGAGRHAAPAGAANGSGPLRGALDAYNAWVESIPGLAQTLRTGAAITQQQAAEIRDSIDVSKHDDVGIRLIGDALLGEGVARGAGLLGRVATRGSAVRPQLARLVAGGADAGAATSIPDPALEQQIAGAVSRLTDPRKIAALSPQRRAANQRVNKLMYFAHTATLNGIDFGRVLRGELAAHGLTPAQADILVANLEESYRLGEQLRVFDGPGWTKLRGGAVEIPGFFSRSGTPGKLQVGHLISFEDVPELVNSLANLRWEASIVNEGYGDRLTQQAVDYGMLLYRTGLLGPTGYAKLRAAALRDGLRP